MHIFVYNNDIIVNLYGYFWGEFLFDMDRGVYGISCGDYRCI